MSTLFDVALQPPAHHNAPVGTSHPAADSVRGIAGALRRQVWEFIQARGKWGATDEEGQAALNMGGNTYRPRRGELEKAGYIVDSGGRRTTTSGRKAAVWVAAGLAAGRSA